ncbi:MAG: hypothetical protein CM1200mP9_10940 [Gammaproteobacteria bacterium]|nr:MAG: hypothetical protein CM1200mP9_10940 [Gammaproteobacteria bacterium]
MDSEKSSPWPKRYDPFLPWPCGSDSSDEPNRPLKLSANAFYDESELTDPVTNEISGWLNDFLERAAPDPFSDEQRRDRMNQVNPLYVLRNYRAQLAIDAAAQGDFASVTELLDVLRKPYTPGARSGRIRCQTPEWARHRVGCSMLSCSS